MIVFMFLIVAFSLISARTIKKQVPVDMEILVNFYTIEGTTSLDGKLKKSGKNSKRKNKKNLSKLWKNLAKVSFLLCWYLFYYLLYE